MAAPFRVSAVFEDPLFLRSSAGGGAAGGQRAMACLGPIFNSDVSRTCGKAGAHARALRIEDRWETCADGVSHAAEPSRKQNKQQFCSSYVTLYLSTAPSGSVVVFINQVALLGRLLFSAAGIFSSAAVEMNI